MAVLTECPRCRRRWPIEPPMVGRAVRCPDCSLEATGADVGRPPGVRRHRATFAFVLGILALAILGIFGPFAWWIGAAETRKMNRGEVDPSGMDLARKAVLLGKIGTVKLGFEVLFILAAVALIVFFAIYAEEHGWVYGVGAALAN